MTQAAASPISECEGGAARNCCALCCIGIGGWIGIVRARAGVGIRQKTACFWLMQHDAAAIITWC